MLPAFIFALSHGEGTVSTALRWTPLTFLGKYVWAFYLLHYPISQMCYVSWTEMYGGTYTDGGPGGLDATAYSPAIGKLSLWGVPTLLLACLVSWWATEYYQPVAVVLLDRVGNVLVSIVKSCFGPSPAAEMDANKGSHESSPLLHSTSTLTSTKKSEADYV